MQPEHQQFIGARIMAEKRASHEVDPSYFEQEQMPEDSDPSKEEEDD